MIVLILFTFTKWKSFYIIYHFACMILCLYSYTRHVFICSCFVFWECFLTLACPINNVYIGRESTSYMYVWQVNTLLTFEARKVFFVANRFMWIGDLIWIVDIVFFFFDNPGNPDTPEGIRLAPKYTSVEGILEGRLFHLILIDGGQRDSNPGL